MLQTVQAMLQILPRPLAFHHFPTIHTRFNRPEAIALVKSCTIFDLEDLTIVLTDDVFLASSSLFNFISR